MVVITPWLCAHPAYKLPEKSVEHISCFTKSDSNSPQKPIELVQFEDELTEAENDKRTLKVIYISNINIFK